MIPIAGASTTLCPLPLFHAASGKLGSCKGRQTKVLTGSTRGAGNDRASPQSPEGCSHTGAGRVGTDKGTCAPWSPPGVVQWGLTLTFSCSPALLSSKPSLLGGY